MFTKIENNYGIISYNERLLKNIIDRAVSPYAGKLVIKGMNFDNTPEGVYVELNISLAFGESISTSTSLIAEEIAKGIETSLELSLNNIVIKISSIVSKKSIKRNIVYDYAKSLLSYN